MRRDEIEEIKRKVKNRQHVTREDSIKMVEWCLDQETYLNHSRIKRDEDGRLCLPYAPNLNFREKDLAGLAFILNKLKDNLAYLEMLGIDYNFLYNYLKDQASEKHKKLANQILIEYHQFISQALYHPQYKPFDSDGLFSMQTAELIFHRDHEEFYKYAVSVRKEQERGDGMKYKNMDFLGR